MAPLAWTECGFSPSLTSIEPHDMGGTWFNWMSPDDANRGAWVCPWIWRCRVLFRPKPQSLRAGFVPEAINTLVQKAVAAQPARRFAYTRNQLVNTSCT